MRLAPARAINRAVLFLLLFALLVFDPALIAQNIKDFLHFLADATLIVFLPVLDSGNAKVIT